MLKTILGTTLLLGVCGFLHAAGEPGAPFVNEKTVLFGRGQMDRIDLAKVEKFVLDAVGSNATSRPADFERFAAGLHGNLAKAERWQAEFKKAGGHEIDMIGESDLLPREGGTLVVPLDSGANAEQIEEMMIPQGTGVSAVQRAQAKSAIGEIIPNKAVLIGPSDARTDMKNMVPVQAPNIAAGISESKDAPEVLIFAPDTAMRNHMLQNLPPAIGMVKTADVVNGVMWAAQFADMPPSPSEHLIVQCRDAASAQKVSMLMGMGLMMLQMAPDAHGQSRTELVQLLAPHVAGDRVEINLDQDQLARLVRAAEPYYMDGVHQQEHVASMNHMRQILLAIVMYQNDHKGEWPKSLDDVKTFLKGGGDLFTNPADPDRHPAYIYVKPKPPIADPAQEMVLYEAHAQFGRGVDVGFADGHIEFISNPQRFKDLLLQSMQENSPDQ